MLRKTRIFVTVGCLCFALCSCETASLSQRSDFESARLYQTEGQLDRATIYYRSYLRDYPQGTYAEEAQFRLGECYLLTGQVPFARRELELYQRRYPQGRFLGQVASYLAGIGQEEERLPMPSEMRPRSVLDKEIAELEEQVKQRPNDVSLRIRLANAYIDVAEPALAEKALGAAEQQASTYAETQQIRSARQRLQQLRRTNASIRATDLYGNPGPLRIAEARGELRRSVSVSNRPQHPTYVVTGQVVNESEKRFSHVEVQVDLYDFFQHLIDTTTVSVGAIGPYGQRAFSAKLSVEMPADEQVSRFECRLIY